MSAVEGDGGFKSDGGQGMHKLIFIADSIAMSYFFSEVKVASQNENEIQIESSNKWITYFKFNYQYNYSLLVLLWAYKYNNKYEH